MPVGTGCHQEGIEPQKGGWALPGGFVEPGEDWAVAATREVVEETGILLSPRQMTVKSCYTTDSNNLIIFGEHAQVKLCVVDFEFTSHETDEVKVIWEYYPIALVRSYELNFSQEFQQDLIC